MSSPPPPTPPAHNPQVCRKAGGWVWSHVWHQHFLSLFEASISSLLGNDHRRLQLQPCPPPPGLSYHLVTCSLQDPLGAAGGDVMIGDVIAFGYKYLQAQWQR